MTFKMNKREHEIMTLAFKIRDVAVDHDPDVIDAAISICVAMNGVDREKNALIPNVAEISNIIASGIAQGMHDAVAKLGVPFESVMGPAQKEETKPSGPAGPLTPEEIAELNKDEPDAK